jgi:hypothetical protein
MFISIRRSPERRGGIVKAMRRRLDWRIKMKKMLVALSLLVMFAGAAVAQTGGSKGTSSKPSTTTSGSVPEAPVGHRQPRASDVPNEKNLSDPNDPLSKENQALDKKIKSICRGC